MSENNSNSKSLLIIILLLLIGLGFTTYKWLETNKQLDQTEVEKIDLQAVYDELEEEYNLALTDINELKDKNVYLDSMMALKEEELKNKRNYIASLLKKQNLSQKELNRVNHLIADFREERLNFETQIDSLVQLSQELCDENMQLEFDKEAISQELEAEKTTREQIEEEKQKIEDKIHRASILSTNNIYAQGIKIKKSGVEADVRKAAQVEKIKMCFDLLENKIAPNGETEMLVRIIGPDGITLYVTSMGSGVFETNMNKQMKYTYMIKPIFENETKKVCSYWDQNLPLKPGQYNIEIYQQGAMIGDTSFELK